MSAPGPSVDERSDPAAERPSLTDSPWFWVYLFGAAALVALFLASNKFGTRQSQIEREYQARTRATQRLNGQEPSIELSTPERTLVTLQPLWYVVAVVTVVGWLLYWRARRAAAPLPHSSAASSHHVDSGQ
jgi:hypothetical protein